MEKKEIRNITEFDKLVRNNKILGKHWYHGIKGEWWHGRSENGARRYLLKLKEEERASTNKIVLISTWNISCGIATYTKYLLESLDKIDPDLFVVDPINDGILKYKNRGILTHLQHESGIVHHPPKIKNKLIVTWHTVSKHTDDSIKEYEFNYNVMAHIIHSEHMRSGIDCSTKDIWIVPHGSMLIPEMKKETARNLLGLNIKMPIGFMFGFQSGDKNYQRLISAARNTGIHLLISGAPHNKATKIKIKNDNNVTFVNRFLTESEVDLYALASDILLFDYVGKSHYSVSGALHRIIGAGRPAICSDIKHFCDIEHEKHCLKFKNQNDLENCIRLALDNNERFGLAARNYAEMTSWEKVAKMHKDIYDKYTSDINKK